MSDFIDRQAFDKCLEAAEKEAVKNRKYVFASALNTVRGNLKNFPSAEPEPCEDAVSRRAVVSRIADLIVLELKGNTPTWNEVYRAVEELPSVQPTIYGYNVEHLVLIANTMKEKGISPEEAIDLFNDVSEIVGLVIDEMTRISEKALERAMGNDV